MKLVKLNALYNFDLTFKKLMLFNIFNRNSILRIYDKYFFQQILRQFWYFITHFILDILNPLKNKIFSLIEKGCPHHKHLKQNTPKSPDIRLKTTNIILQQLRGHIPSIPNPLLTGAHKGRLALDQLLTVFGAVVVLLDLLFHVVDGLFGLGVEHVELGDKGGPEVD